MLLVFVLFRSPCWWNLSCPWRSIFAAVSLETDIDLSSTPSLTSSATSWMCSCGHPRFDRPFIHRFIAQDRPKTAQDRPKTAPRPPKTAPDPPKGATRPPRPPLPDSPKCAPRGSKIALRALKFAPRIPRRIVCIPKESPRVPEQLLISSCDTSV